MHVIQRHRIQQQVAPEAQAVALVAQPNGLTCHAHCYVLEQSNTIANIITSTRAERPHYQSQSATLQSATLDAATRTTKAKMRQHKLRHQSSAP